MSEGSSNITMKLNYIYIIIIPIYSFTDKLHCLINTATALLELMTDCSIRVSRSFMTKKDGGAPLMYSIHLVGLKILLVYS